MNKKFSTLLCGALALFSFSANAQTWMKIQTSAGQELVKKGDSVVVVAQGAPETKTAASLWSVDVVSRETSGNKIYQFTNKATNTTLKLKNNDVFAVGQKEDVWIGYSEFLFASQYTYTLIYDILIINLHNSRVA